jgi:hypothetical protein
MTENEAIEEVGNLVGLFPRMQQEQVDFWHGRFLMYPRDKVRAAVTEFAAECGDFVDRPGLIAEIENQIGRPSADERMRVARAAAQAKQDESRRQINQVRATWKQIDEVIAAIPDDELEEYRKLAIDKAFTDGVLKASGCEFLMKAKTRKSSILKSLIYPMVA